MAVLLIQVVSHRGDLLVQSVQIRQVQLLFPHAIILHQVFPAQINQRVLLYKEGVVINLLLVDSEGVGALELDSVIHFFLVLVHGSFQLNRDR